MDLDAGVRKQGMGERALKPRGRWPDHVQLGLRRQTNPRPAKSRLTTSRLAKSRQAKSRK